MSTCWSNTIKGFGQTGREADRREREEGWEGRRAAGPALRGLISWTRRSPVKRHVKKRVPLTFSLMNDPKRWERSRQCRPSRRRVWLTADTWLPLRGRGVALTATPALAVIAIMRYYILCSAKLWRKTFKGIKETHEKNLRNILLEHLLH